MSGYTIVHLSDLHIGRKFAYPTMELADLTADSLATDFELLSEEYSLPFRPEETFVIITGDLTHHATWQEYADAAAFIRMLRTRFGQRLRTDELPADHVICIPGNHDVEVPERDPNDAALRQLKYRNFKLFLHNYSGNSDFATGFTLDNPFVSVRTWAPFRLHLLDLNSTLSRSCYSKEDPGSRALITDDHLSRLDALLKPDDNALRIALTHYPLEAFPSEDDPGKSQRSLREWLLHRGFRILLSGHLHLADGTVSTSILSGSGIAELVTGHSFLTRQLETQDATLYQVMRLESNDDCLTLYRRRYVYAYARSGHWEAESSEQKNTRTRVPGLIETIGATDQNSFLGIGRSQGWAVVTHCEPVKFQHFGVLPPGEQVNANVLAVADALEGQLDRVSESTVPEWSRYASKSALFLVDSPHYNPYVRSILQMYGAHLAGGAVRFEDSRSTPVVQQILVHQHAYRASRSVDKPFGEFDDYLLMMRLPGMVPRTGEAREDMPDIDEKRVIWVIAGIHSKASYAGAMMLTQANLQSLAATLARLAGGVMPRYFEMVCKVPEKPSKVMSFRQLEIVHFSPLLLKSEIALADELPSGVAARFASGHARTIPLSVLHLDVSAACNYDCPTCIEKHVKDKRLFLSTGACIKVLCDFRDAGCERLDFYGGEPTLHPDFADILRVASGMGFGMLLVTNGSKLDDERIAEAVLEARGRIRLRVSLDAHSEPVHRTVHRVTDGPGYFSKIDRNVRSLIQHGASVTISFLLTRQNVHEVAMACAYWRAHHASAFIIRPSTPRGGEIPDLAWMARHRKTLDAALRDYQGFAFTPKWFETYLATGRPDATQQKSYRTCYSAYYRVAVSPYGGREAGQGADASETDQAWISLCTYRRYNEKFGCRYPKDFKSWRASERFTRLADIDPSAQCSRILCCRDECNRQIAPFASSAGAV